MRNIQILMHTHWDREWYFTKDETKVLLRYHLCEVIEFLEENRPITYILDGQTIMIDDFLEFEPLWHGRLVELIKNGQLQIGPWYSQTDLLLVAGESVIRNLYYGIKQSKALGSVMLHGYAPDTFGHSGQMPQIYHQFGIESSFFWRGFSSLKAKKSDFLWQGLDGSTIYGVNLATGYQGAKYLEHEPHALKERMEKIMKVLDHFSASSSRLIMNGHDQMPIQKNILAIKQEIEKIYPDDTVTLASFDDYINSLKKNNCLETVTGELIDAQHARIHRTIASTRMDIKLLNSDAEYKIYHLLEPLAILATQLKLDYPFVMLERCQKELFAVHAHDSIGGCNSDKVNQDIKQRLLNINETLDTQIELYQRLICLAATNHYPTVITVTNPLPYQRLNNYVKCTLLSHYPVVKIYDGNKELDVTLISQTTVDAGLIDRQVAAKLLDTVLYQSEVIIHLEHIDGLSVKYLSYSEHEGLTSKVPHQTGSIDNTHYRLEIVDHQINLFDKQQNKLYKNIISIENSGDAGDSYDYSPPIKDHIFNHKNTTITNIEQKNSHNVAILSCDITFILPANSKERESGLASTPCSFHMVFELTNNNSFVDCSISHTNQLADSRFRLVFNPAMLTKEVESDTFLASQKKPVFNHEELAIWEQDGWVEKPVSIETYNSYVALKQNHLTAFIASYGLKEYEVVDGAIYLTLLRSFSHLGKRHLINRPGRPSGIEIATPDNQLLGRSFNFKVRFGLTDQPINLSRSSKEFLTPLIAYQLKPYNRFNINKPKSMALINKKLNLALNGATVSALKMNDEQEIFIRLFNASSEMIEINLDNAFESTMMEQKAQAQRHFNLKPQEIKNIIITQLEDKNHD